MKAETKWGKGNSFGYRTISCPACGYLFVLRRRKRCPRCKVGLYAGREILMDENGYWWHPEKQEWVKISSMRKEVITARPGESMYAASRRIK